MAQNSELFVLLKEFLFYYSVLWLIKSALTNVYHSILHLKHWIYFSYRQAKAVVLYFYVSFRRRKDKMVYMLSVQVAIT